MHSITKINTRLKDIIEVIQQTPVSLTYLAITLVGITFVRNFIELYASHHEFNLEHFLHYTLFYIALALSLGNLFVWITRDKVIHTVRLLVPFFIIIWIAPVIDLLVSGQGGQQMAYILEHDNLPLQYLTFFGPVVEFGISIGMRIEIALVLLGSFWFFWVKTGSALKTIFGTWMMYSVIFMFVSLPAIISLFGERLGVAVIIQEIPLGQIFFLVSLVLGTILVVQARPKESLLIAKDIRPLRWTHFQFMFILGVCLAVYFGDAALSDLISFSVLFDWIFIIISITGAWMYSIIINNLEDIEIDSVSNPNRMTVTRAIDEASYRSVSWWVLLISISSAALVSFEHMFLVLVFIALYFLYSAPPLRLKRILVLSKGIIALNSLLLVTAGYTFLVSSDLEFIVPSILLPTFLIGMTMVLNFIDLKDYEGDKQAGIKTLPVVLGMDVAQQIIGWSFITTYASVYFITQDAHLLPILLLVGLAQYLLVTRKEYKEWPVLTLHLVGLVPAFVYLLIM